MVDHQDPDTLGCESGGRSQAATLLDCIGGDSDVEESFWAGQIYGPARQGNPPSVLRHMRLHRDPPVNHVCAIRKTLCVGQVDSDTQVWSIG